MTLGLLQSQAPPIKCFCVDGAYVKSYKKNETYTNVQHLNSHFESLVNLWTHTMGNYCWINPFSPTLSLIAAKISLSKHSTPYWSNPPFQFFYSGTLALSPKRQAAGMSKNKKGRLDQYGAEGFKV